MAPRKQNTEVLDWQKEMEQQAEIAAATQRSSGGGGKFFSMLGGILQYDGTPMPGNQMAVIILADVLENSYYDTAYDPSTPTSPKCFAFAKTEADLEPHSAVDTDPYFERQNDVCQGCERNEWGSARVGRGKACSNVQRLAMIPAGVYKAQGKGRNTTFELDLYDDPEHFAKAEVAFMKLSVMNVRHYSTFVKQLAADMRRPPHGVIALVFIEPDPKSQFKVSFELIDTVPDEFMPILMKRHAAEQASIDFPYQPPQVAEEPKPGKSANKLRGKR